MRRRLSASASDASRAALNSSKQREAPPLPPDLLNLQEAKCRPSASFHAIADESFSACPSPNERWLLLRVAVPKAARLQPTPLLLFAGPSAERPLLGRRRPGSNV